MLADRKCERLVLSVVDLQYSDRYTGACPWMHLNTRTAVLNWSLCRTGSQSSSRITGVMQWNCLAPVTSRAAAFWSDCSVSNSRPLTPTKSLQFYLPPTRLSTSEMNPTSCLYSQPHSVTILWPVLIFHPTEGRRLSWPEWLVTNWGSFPTCRWSPIPVLTRPGVE